MDLGARTSVPDPEGLMEGDLALWDVAGVPESGVVPESNRG
jgi:hypothetical protein